MKDERKQTKKGKFMYIVALRSFVKCLKPGVIPKVG